MAKSLKLKSEKNWDRLYDAYLRQHERSSMNLRGNIEDTLTKVEYKSLYKNMLNSGITQNITRTIVQKEARVSGRQALRRLEVARRIMKEVEMKIDLGEQVPYYEYKVYRELLKTRLSVKAFRTDDYLTDLLSDYVKAYNKDEERLRLEQGKREDEEVDEISFTEFITSP